MSAHSGNTGPCILTQHHSSYLLIMHILSLLHYSSGFPFRLLQDHFRYVRHLPGSCRYLTLECLSWSILIIQLSLLLFQEKGMPVFKWQETERSVQQSPLSTWDTFSDPQWMPKPQIVLNLTCVFFLYIHTHDKV